MVWALTKTLDCGAGRRCWSRGDAERCVFEKAVKKEVWMPKSTRCCFQDHYFLSIAVRLLLREDEFVKVERKEGRLNRRKVKD